MTALHGRRVLVTRQRAQAAPLVEALSARGAVPVVFPTIDVRPVADTGALDASLDRLESYRWIAFTSRNAVDCFYDRAAARGRTVPRTVRLAAVGTATSDALVQRGRAADFVPDEFRGARLGRDLPHVAGAAVLLPCAAAARDEAVSALRLRGAAVHPVVVYETMLPDVDSAARAELDAGIDIATFASPSAVENFFALLGPAAPRLLARAIVACIGPVTGAAARSLGLTVHVQPDEYTVPGLVAALEAHAPCP